MTNSMTEGRLRPVLAAISSLAKPVVVEPGAVPPAGGGTKPAPFVTISRQAGAGGTTLATRLVERLNQDRPSPDPWRVYDRELVEKVATDYHLSERLIESVEEAGHSWLNDLLAGLSYTGPEASELSIYRRVAITIRALAQPGRVVIVGRGGVYVTRDLPGGVHVRLIAPLEQRVQHIMRLRHLTAKAAAAWVHHADKNRVDFYRAYWGQPYPPPEAFALTINTAAVEDESAVAMLLPLIAAAEKPRVQVRPRQA